jgi:isopentenyl phosphate kinase
VSIIEGVTMGGAKNTKNTNESIEIKQMKQKLKIMENDITNKVEPKLNKVIEKIKSTKAEVNAELKKESDDKINSFSEGNKKNTSVSKQDRVPPFSSSEISNVI